MYGAQAVKLPLKQATRFENDVEMYGAQALPFAVSTMDRFENDVEMYGAQANTENGHNER